MRQNESWGGPIVKLWGPRVEPRDTRREGYSMRYEEGRGTLAAWASVAPWTLAANERPGMMQSDQWAGGSGRFQLPTRGGCQASSSSDTPQALAWLLVLAKYSLTSDIRLSPGYSEQMMALRVPFGLCLCIVFTLSLQQTEASPRVPVGAKVSAGAKRAAGC